MGGGAPVIGYPTRALTYDPWAILAVENVEHDWERPWRDCQPCLLVATKARWRHKESPTADSNLTIVNGRAMEAESPDED